MFSNIYQKPDFLNPPVAFKNIPGAHYRRPEYVMNNQISSKSVSLLSVLTCTGEKEGKAETRAGGKQTHRLAWPSKYEEFVF
jgi:hypothetical protein